MTTTARGPIATSRRLPAATAVLVLLAALLWPIPAAASESFDTWPDLQGALSSCDGTTGSPTTVTLIGNITQTDGTLTVGCVAVLDLGVFDLAVRNVVINTGQQLTITGGSSADGGTLTADARDNSDVVGIHTTGATLIVQSGTVTASGGVHAAGIGGRLHGAGGSVMISGGTVTGSGGMHGAGIGGGQAGAGGTVGISGGTVAATGSGHAAGIGGGYWGAGGTVEVSGGTVTATGHGSAAGIGGGINGAGGSVEISSGTVTATGDGSAAGIGGGSDGAGGAVSISGGTVEASGATDAAGIGGGLRGAGGDVQIDAGAVVTARGGHTAIGAGTDASSFGSLAVAGTLRLPAGSLRIPSGIVVAVADSGQILGGTDPTVGTNLLGNGHIDNQGAIALRASHVTTGGVTVSGHHYRVAFDAAGGSPTPDDVTVFASSFETGLRDFPTDPTRDDELVFIGWTTQPDGAGDPFTATDKLPGSSDDGQPVEVTAHAYWSVLSLDSGLTDDTTTITAGEHTTFTPTVTDSNDQPFHTDPAGWTIGDADGLIDTTIDPDSGQITLTSTTAGTYPLELHIPAANLTTTITLHVEHAAATVLHLDVAGTTVTQGDTVTITVTGTDEHANPTGDISDEIIFTSDVATDVIDGNTITFPTASPHTITATHTSGVTATLVFTITPAATDDDPSTDDEPPSTEPGPAPTDKASSAAPTAGTVSTGLVPIDQTVAPTTESSSAAAGSLPATGTNPLGMLIAALLSALAGTLLLRRSANRHQDSQVALVP